MKKLVEKYNEIIEKATEAFEKKAEDNKKMDEIRSMMEKKKAEVGQLIGEWAEDARKEINELNKKLSLQFSEKESNERKSEIEIKKMKENFLHEIDEFKDIIEEKRNMDIDARENQIAELESKQKILGVRIDKVNEGIENYKKKYNTNSKLYTDGLLVLEDNKKRWQEEYEKNEKLINVYKIKDSLNAYKLLDDIKTKIKNLDIKNVEQFKNEKPFEKLQAMIEESKTKQNEEQKKEEKDPIINPEVKEEQPINESKEEKVETKKEDIIVEPIKLAKNINVVVSAEDGYVYADLGEKMVRAKLEDVSDDKSKILRRLNVKSMIKDYTKNPVKVMQIENKCNPAVLKVLGEMQDKEMVKAYVESLMGNSELPFDLYYEMENSKLDKKVNKENNKYARNERFTEGTIVVGDVQEKISKRLGLFGRKVKALPAAQLQKIVESDKVQGAKTKVTEIGKDIKDVAKYQYENAQYEYYKIKGKINDIKDKVKSKLFDEKPIEEVEDPMLKKKEKMLQELKVDKEIQEKLEKVRQDLGKKVREEMEKDEEKTR